MDTEMDFWGYTYTAHEITTEDNYIVTMFRVTGLQDGTVFSPDKPPVVIVHG